MDREITLRDYGRVLWSGRWIILASTVVAGLVALLLTFATTTTYTATSEVFLGQATTISGVPVSTPLTNPATAPQALESDAIVGDVAEAVGVAPSRVRDGATLTAPRAPGGAAGNQPTLVTITFVDDEANVAREGANAYAAEVLERALEPFDQTLSAFESRLRRARQDVVRLRAQVEQSQNQLRSAPPAQQPILQSILFTAQEQLSVAQAEVGTQELNIAKARQIEEPEIVSLSENPTSSGSAPRRARTVLL
ncbi:MAG: Wzz/FepE/Etk N-terminal domain-containing protein, partial [Miltoncostaeaceae bacterium]